MSSPTRNPSGRMLYWRISRKSGGTRTLDFSGLSFQVPTIKGVVGPVRSCARAGDERTTMTESANRDDRMKSDRLSENVAPGSRGDHRKRPGSGVDWRRRAAYSRPAARRRECRPVPQVARDDAGAEK